LNLRRFEGRSVPDMGRELLPRVNALLLEGEQVLGEILAAYESSTPDDVNGSEFDPGVELGLGFDFEPEPDLGSLPEPLASTSNIGPRRNEIRRDDPDARTRAVADLSFMGRMELLGLHQRVIELSQRSERADPSVLLAECATAQRSLLRSCAAVERALRADAGLTSRRRPGAELIGSLALRKAYAQLRRELSDLEEPSREELPARLERMTVRLGQFIYGPDFDLAWLEDRIRLRNLHERLCGWLASDENQRDFQNGLRLWQDLTSCTTLLGQINLRVELIEADRSVVREAGRRLRSRHPPTFVPERLLQRLERLYGRDDTIDGLLDSGSGRLAVEWQEPLDRLEKTLRAHPGLDSI
jgi:hypothetical protein